MQLFSLAFIAQREICVYSLWSCMPVLYSQQTMLWRNEVLQRSAIFLTKHPLQPKSCCYLQAGGCFWASIFFSGRNLFVKVGLFKNNMCYLRCVLCSEVQFSCLSFIMVTFLQVDAVFFKDWILNLKLQSYLKNENKQFSLNNRNNSVSKYALCPLKM